MTHHTAKQSCWKAPRLTCEVSCRYGEEGLKGGAGGMGGAGQYANPFDIFESFFGSSSGFGGPTNTNRAKAPQQGNDERFDMVIDFHQAVFGCR